MEQGLFRDAGIVNHNGRGFPFDDNSKGSRMLLGNGATALHGHRNVLGARPRDCSYSGISPVGNERFRVGDAHLLKRPDGTEIMTDIGGLEFLTPNPDHELTVMHKQLDKNDVPAGTGVWSVDNEHTEDQKQPTRKPPPFNATYTRQPILGSPAMARIPI